MTNNTKAAAGKTTKKPAPRKRTKKPASKGTRLKQAKLMVQEDEQKRHEECTAELEKVLVKYGFILQTTPSQIVLALRVNIPEQG